MSVRITIEREDKIEFVVTGGEFVVVAGQTGHFFHIPFAGTPERKDRERDLKQFIGALPEIPK